MDSPRTQSFSRANAWHRDRYRIALVGPACLEHETILQRAGYQVMVAADGQEAGEILTHAPVDVIVIDFAMQGRPPEAVLLFSHRTSGSAPVLAIVPADESDCYRRAFLAGAKDVLAAPARPEDLVASVDMVLEPRALNELLLQLRMETHSEGETPQHPESNSDADAEDPLALGRERDLQVRLGKAEEEAENFRSQALEAITERDRAVKGRMLARRRLAQAKKELRERDAHNHMIDKVCEELQRKLKDIRTQKRQFEGRCTALQQRLQTLQLRQSQQRPGDLPPHGATPHADLNQMLEPEEGLQLRASDEQHLQELEAAWEHVAVSEARIAELETVHASSGEEKNPGAAFSETATVPEQPTRLASDASAPKEEGELRALRKEREQAKIRVRELEARLHTDDPLIPRKPLSQLRQDLEQARDEHAETLGTLDAVRMERDTFRKRLDETEREIADALTRLEELEPLGAEVEEVRSELHAERLNHQTTRRNLEAIIHQFTVEHPPREMPADAPEADPHAEAGEPREKEIAVEAPE